jgi:hypothetical protein
MMNVASNEHVYTRDLEQRALAQLKSYLPITYFLFTVVIIYTLMPVL